jgi:hypothetical protein
MEVLWEQLVLEHKTQESLKRRQKAKETVADQNACVRTFAVISRLRTAEHI